MDFDRLARINLIKGAGGGDPKAGLCIMEMVSYFDGADRVTDRPECACPFLTDIAIGINDAAPSQKERDTLKPLLPLLAGSRDEASRKKRAWFVMREHAVRILAVSLDKIDRQDLADPIRAATTPDNLHAAVLTANGALKKYAYAYANAYANAYAYANAAYANAIANAAYAYANAIANAAYAYTYAANANTNANAAKERSRVFAVMREILTEAIKLGAHGGLDLEAPATQARADKLLEALGL